jgi:Tfp pilus assembly protein PilF
VRIALRRLDLLPVAYRDVARGLNSYLTGDADSAILYLRRAIRTDSTVRGAWPLLGEVYSRLLPTDTPADSLATDALERSRRVEPEFAPALLLLEEMAFRRGEEQRAFALREELRRAGADTTHSLERDLMLRCVRDGPGAIDWRQATRRDALSVLSAGKILSEGAAQPACALAAFRAVLDGDSVKQNRRRGALAGVNGLLVALDRGDELRALLASHAAAGLGVPTLYMLDAASHAGFEREARAAADSIGTRYETVDPTTLWLLGSLAARVGDVARLRGINSALIAKADSSQSRRDVLISHAIAARLSVLEGDSAGAIRALTALKPSAPRGQIAWGQPWESLGLERMQLAEVLMARRQYDAARHVASQLDATEPVMYLVQLRRSLELRVTGARQLGDRQSVATYQRRLVALRRFTSH